MSARDPRPQTIGATVRVYVSVAVAVVWSVLQDLRETLPDDERTAAAWVSGLAYGLAIMLIALVASSACTLAAAGGR